MRGSPEGLPPTCFFASLVPRRGAAFPYNSRATLGCSVFCSHGWKSEELLCTEGLSPSNYWTHEGFFHATTVGGL